MDTQAKICSHCKQEYPLSNFSKNKSQKDGYANQCKTCSTAGQLPHRERRASYMKEWRRKNLEHERARDKERYWADESRRSKTPQQKELRRDAKYRKLFGITKNDYERMLEAQNNQCANPSCDYVYDGTNNRLAVDHVHDETGRVRALLCQRCNLILTETVSPTFLRSLADYLEVHAVVAP